MKIGLYFGSFNPIHHGHLIIATHIVEHTDLDQTWFVVSPQNPLKPAAGLLNEYHRLHLVRLAIEGSDNLKVSDIEFRLPRPSFTIDTLTYLSEKYPQHQFTVLMGSDSYQNLPKWKNFEQLIAHYPIYVYLRPGFPVDEQFPGVEQGRTLPDIQVLKAPMLEISATHIRSTLREGKSIRYLVPSAVEGEILRQNYFR